MSALLCRRLALLIAGLAGLGAVVVPPAAAVGVTCTVTADMVSAANYWVANGTDLDSNDWQNATFHVGNLDLVRTTGVSNHRTLPWAQANNYQLQSEPNGPFFADYMAAGEAYLALQFFHPDRTTLQALEDRVNAEVASVQSGQTRYWNTVDALNMAMPSFTQLAVLDNSQADLDAMHTLFEFTKSGVAGRGLYNPLIGLWHSDASTIGTNTFWSRGNGWALAAMAKTLTDLPATDPHRAEYLQVFQRMALTLLFLQRPDGFWNVDLTNPFDHPGPETTGVVPKVEVLPHPEAAYTAGAVGATLVVFPFREGWCAFGEFSGFIVGTVVRSMVWAATFGDQVGGGPTLERFGNTVVERTCAYPLYVTPGDIKRWQSPQEAASAAR